MQSIKWVNPPLRQTVNETIPAKKIARLEKKLLHYCAKAILQYEMIKEGDRILVCVSGGKDSITMLTLLNLLRKRAKVRFEIKAFTLDQVQPGWDDSHLRRFYQENDLPFEILSKDTFTIVKEKTEEGGTYCSMCSRLRRGIIYSYAREHGFNKVALGHHRDDLITSLLMSIFYNGEIRTMPPKLLTDDATLILIRPLSLCQEKDIAEYAKLKQFPIIPCNLCGSQENLARKKVNRLIQGLAVENPKIPSNMLRALQQVRISQLMDHGLWDFKGLEKKVFSVMPA